MGELPARSKTVVWFFLTAVGIPALAFAGEQFASGNEYVALGGAVLGAAALVAFAVSYLAEFPAEDDIKAVVADAGVTDEKVEDVARDIGETIREETKQPEEKLRDGDGEGSG